MLTWLRSRSRAGQTASGLYGSIVTQARTPAFYTRGAAPDTIEGRFGVIAVHMFLVLERIRQEGAAGNEFARALLEHLLTDMDDSLREIGIGDMGVPRRVKKAAAALHEQIEVYRSALAAPSDEALKAAIASYVLLDNGSGDPALLANYVRRATLGLTQQPWSEIGAGRIAFPVL